MEIMSALIVFGIAFLIFLVCRELMLWYWKVNKIVSLLEEIKNRLGQDQAIHKVTANSHPAYSMPRIKIVSINESSIIKNSGIRPGDIIYKYNNKILNGDTNILMKEIEICGNEKIKPKILCLRDGSEFTVEIPNGRLGVVLVTEG